MCRMASVARERSGHRWRRLVRRPRRSPWLSSLFRCEHVYFAASLDGGSSFLPEVKESTAENVPTLRRTPRRADDGWAGGDYFGLAAAAEGSFRLLWADSRIGVYDSGAPACACSTRRILGPRRIAINAVGAGGAARWGAGKRGGQAEPLGPVHERRNLASVQVTASGPSRTPHHSRRRPCDCRSRNPLDRASRTRWGAMSRADGRSLLHCTADAAGLPHPSTGSTGATHGAAAPIPASPKLVIAVTLFLIGGNSVLQSMTVQSPAAAVNVASGAKWWRTPRGDLGSGCGGSSPVVGHSMSPVADRAGNSSSRRSDRDCSRSVRRSAGTGSECRLRERSILFLRALVDRHGAVLRGRIALFLRWSQPRALVGHSSPAARRRAGDRRLERQPSPSTLISFTRRARPSAQLLIVVRQLHPLTAAENPRGLSAMSSVPDSVTRVAIAPLFTRPFERGLVPPCRR